MSTATSPLPVTLLEFTTLAEGTAAVHLAWATAAEVSNDSFTVERSLDSRAFTAIGMVLGAGSSTVRHYYTLLDDHLPAGAELLYYRLRQANIDGTTSYSPVRTVRFPPTHHTALATPANQAHSSLMAAGLPANAPVEVLDALGRCVTTATTDATGTVRLLLPASLAAGVYLVRSNGQTQRLLVD